MKKIFTWLIMSGFLIQPYCQAMKASDFLKSKNSAIQKLNKAKSHIENCLKEIQLLTPNNNVSRKKFITKIRKTLNLASQAMLPNSVRQALASGIVPAKIKKSYTKGLTKS